MPHFPRFSAIALLALLWLACCPPARPAPYDMVEMTVASAPGLGTITFGTALIPYRPLSATGAVSGELVPYHISDGANWENGRGIVNFGTNITLTRGPLSSSNGGGLITATSSAIVWVATLAEDSVTTVYPSSVLTQVDQPICPLTDAATILSDAVACLNDPTKGVGTNSVTLTTARTLGLPSRLRSTGGQSILYMITHSGSADGPTLAAGFEYPGATQPPECNGSTVTTSCWSIGTQTDWLQCVSIDGSHIGCGPVLTNMAVFNPLIVGTPVQGKGGSGGSQSQSVTISSFGINDSAIVPVAWCGTNTCTANGAENITTVTATGGSCALIPGTNTGVATPLPIALYRCTGMSAGSVTFTANWGANAFFQLVDAIEIKNSSGAEAGNNAVGNSTAPAATTGTLSQLNGELVIAVVQPFNTITAVAAPFTLISFSDGSGLGYLSVTGCSSCTKTATFTQATGQWSVAIAGILR